jgi:hypothetical protein|nr:MAG TPA: hypothetical protein [Caudoviricetes sp.]
MEIPNISEQFAAIFAGPVVNVDETLKHTGHLIFTEADIAASSNDLDRLLRMVFVQNQITYEYFSQKCKKYSVEVLNNHDTENSTQSNLLRALQKGNITNNRFVEAIALVLGYIITDRSLTLTSPDGTVTTYNVSDSYKYDGICKT